MTGERIEMVTRREADELRALYRELAPSTGDLTYSVSDTASLDETVALIRAKLSHYPERHMIYAVQSTNEGEGAYTLCITGNGPKAEVNAQWIALALPRVPALLERLVWLERTLSEYDARLTVFRNREEPVQA